MIDTMGNWFHQSVTMTYGVYVCYAILWLFAGWCVGTMMAVLHD